MAVISRIKTVIRAQADFLGMSLEELSDRAGLGRSTVQRIVTSAGDFNVGTLLAIIEALDLSPGEFFAMVDEGRRVFEARDVLHKSACDLERALEAYREAAKDLYSD